MSIFAPDPFAGRHIGPTEADIKKMLDTLGLDSIDAMLDDVVPASIRSKEPLTALTKHKPTRTDYSAWQNPTRTPCACIARKRHGGRTN